MVTEKKQINFTGLQNNRRPSQCPVNNVHIASGNCPQRPLWEWIAEPLSHVLTLTPAGACGLLSVSPPEEHHERRKFFRRDGNPRTCDSGSSIDS
jgi:hypothetical protein